MDFEATQAGKVRIYVANESDKAVWFDELQVEHQQEMIVQENHYYPFGMEMVGLGKVGSPSHRFTYNGKELLKEFNLGWYDYGARSLDPQLGRWHGVDPLAEKYYPMSPYNYVLNNPIKNIDINGDSVNVYDLRDMSPEDYMTMEAELEEMTGLILTADAETGNLTYEMPEGDLGGSKRARKMLMKAINNRKMVTVKDNRGNSSKVPMESKDEAEQNTIMIDFDQLDGFVNGTSKDLSPKAYGYGINFFHELGHTGVGGKLEDWLGKDVTRIGSNVINVNVIRRQMSSYTGKNYGQRVDYRVFNVYSDPNYVYSAFSHKALQSLKKNLKPKSGYVKNPGY